MQNAIILSAGTGSRMVPITYETPKGLIRVRGEILIERQIKQLHAAGIRDIYVVVGYMKERFEYLKNQFGVKLIHNPDFWVKNNLSSLYHARHVLCNSIISIADIWLSNNIFFHQQPESWYACKFIPSTTEEWYIKTANGYISNISKGGQNSWVLMGPAFLNFECSKKMISLLERYYQSSGSANMYWEDILIGHLQELPIRSFQQPEDTIFEFETLEELRRFDSSYFIDSGNSTMKQIAGFFRIPESKICSIQSIKTGMTNLTFSFKVNDRFYVFRKPKEFKNKIINRKHECQVYQALFNDREMKAHIEDLCFFDTDTGIKISRMLPDARVSDPRKRHDIELGLNLLRKLHRNPIRVGHQFNIFRKIRSYESLLASKPSPGDYTRLRSIVFSLEDHLPPAIDNPVLCHIDFVHTNVLISGSKAYLIDWEYAAMGDPLTDIAMYALFAAYSETEIVTLLAKYLQRQPLPLELFRVYIYIAAGGLLWGLWADLMGMHAHYGKGQYRYARKYGTLVKLMVNDLCPIPY